jgi:hypothetical protein
MSEGIIIALIGVAGSVLVALIGLVGTLASNARLRERSGAEHGPQYSSPRPAFFYAVMLAGIANLMMMSFLLGQGDRSFVINAIFAAGSFVIAFFRRRG